MDVLITRPARVGPFNVSTLDRALKAVCTKVQAVTVAHHCEPYAVFVHCSEALSEEELATVKRVVDTHGVG